MPDVLDFECPGDSGAHTALDQPEASLPGTIIGNRKSQKYHKATCPGFKKVAPKNQVTFPNEEEAEAAGYHKAANCR